MTHGPHQNQSRSRVPRVVRYLAWYLLMGTLSGMLAAVLVIEANVSGLKDLMLANDLLMPGTALLMFLFALTFASVAMGIGVMMIGHEPEDDKGG